MPPSLSRQRGGSSPHAPGAHTESDAPPPRFEQGDQGRERLVIPGEGVVDVTDEEVFEQGAHGV